MTQPKNTEHSEKIWLKLLAMMLSRLVKRGSLTVIDATGERHMFGDGAAPAATIRLADAALYRKLFTNPELAAGEAYMDGALTLENSELADFLQVFHVNAPNLRNAPTRRALADLARRFRRFAQNNPIGRARENVAHHYDLSNDFYRKILDADMNYSCAYFERADITLEEAQRAKQRHIAAKLDLKPGMRVLDIGSGWGGLALYIAEHFDVDVTGVTLSTEQQKLASERARGAGLADRVRFELRDYRDLTSAFDRIVSVGMFEHVGAPHYLEFFNKVDDLLTADGLALLHAIGHRSPPNVTGPWIRKYIFPGGYSPALSETFAAIEKSRLWTTDIEIWRLHYAETLRSWNDRFQAHRAEIVTQFDERFCRMFEFYLTTSEFAFRHGGHFVFQIQLAKAPDGAPITRDYMSAAEMRLRDSDAERGE